MSELTEAEKAVFLAATNRRKERGIRLRRICLLAEESQVVAFNEIWDSWCIRWTKQGAMDRLLRVMCSIEARMRDQEGRK
jgi:hypothetical protein